MKKLLVILLVFGFVVIGFNCQTVQALEDETITYIGADSGEMNLVMFVEENNPSISADEDDEDEGDEDDGGEEGEEEDY